MIDEIQSYIISSVIGLVITIVTGWLIRKIPKDGFFKKFTMPLANKNAIITYFFLKKFFKKKSNMKKIDEGIFETIAYQLVGYIRTFETKIDELIDKDNDK